jgi:hypothetical protein
MKLAYVCTLAALMAPSVFAAVTVFPGEIYRVPQSWTERAYPKLICYMVKTAANPGGLPKEVFDGFQAQLAANRAQFYYDLPAGRSMVITGLVRNPLRA